jgi:hypothetical protein
MIFHFFRIFILQIHQKTIHWCNLKWWNFHHYLGIQYTAVIIIKRVSTFVDKVENPYNYIRILDLIDKCRYAFCDYDGSIRRKLNWRYSGYMIFYGIK